MNLEGDVGVLEPRDMPSEWETLTGESGLVYGDYEEHKMEGITVETEAEYWNEDECHKMEVARGEEREEPKLQ